MSTSREKLAGLLQQVDAKTAELADLKPLKPEDEARLWKKFRLEWNFNSNHIEGNTLTYAQTELLLMFDQTPGEPHTLRELEEMKAHDVAVALIRDWATDQGRNLTEADIRDLNQTILVRPFWKEAITADGQDTRRLISVGSYKEHPNSVRLPNGDIFHYTAPEEVQREMGELMDWYRTKGATLHPVVTAALLHYRFVCIHPFDDGNGRISRLLLNYHLLRNDLPPVVIKSADKKNYLFALNQADVGDLDAFCGYVAEQLLWSLDLSIRAAGGESVEEMGDWEKEVELLKRKLEAHHEDVSNQKRRLESTTIKWLENNIPILITEMKQKLGAFARFFRDNNLKVLIFELQGSQINIFESKLDWSIFYKGVREIKYDSRISLLYTFNDFIYGTQLGRIQNQLSVEVSIVEENVIISTLLDSKSITETTIYSDLTKDDLKPVRDLSEAYYKQIEKAVQKLY